MLVCLQAGRHLCQWVGVTLMEGLFPKVLVLEPSRSESVHTAIHIQISGTHFPTRFVFFASLCHCRVTRKTEMTSLCTDKKMIGTISHSRLPTAFYTRLVSLPGLLAVLDDYFIFSSVQRHSERHSQRHSQRHRNSQRDSQRHS